MQNLTQFNPNKNTQVISSQVLAEYFSNHDEPLELEKTSQGFLLNIPKSFLDKDIDKNLITENKATRSANLFGFMLDKPFNIPDDFDEMYAEEIEALFAGAESSDEHLI